MMLRPRKERVVADATAYCFAQVVLVIEGGGHGLIWTHRPEFERAVDDFLAAP
jgi:hypothetical protein